MFDKLPKDVIRVLIVNYFDPLSSLRILQTCKVYKHIITEGEFQVICNQLKYINRVKYLTKQVLEQLETGNHVIEKIDEKILCDCIRYFADENNYEKLINVTINRRMI